MTMFSVALLLLLAADCVKCQTLTQPTSVTVQPGQRLTINCQVSYSLSSYGTNWIRQPAGKGLEWIGYSCSGCTAEYKDSLRSQFSITLDSSSNTVTLSGQNMQPGDTAVYYCARESHHCDDYWGKGTMVTVTSATPIKPSVFPLTSCDSGTGDIVTLGCLATGFSPLPVTYTWRKDGVDITDFIQYPAVLKDNFYTGVSQLRVRRQDWTANPKPSYTCVAENTAGNGQVTIRPTSLRVVSPNITLQPTWEGEFGTSSVTLVCSLSGYFPDKLTVEWQMDDDSASIGGISRKLQSVQEKEKTFSLTSEIKPNATKWNSGTRFTCKSTHNSIDYIKTISICDVHANVPPSIHVEIPSLETVVNATSQVQATCLVRTVFGANVTWVTDGHIVPEGKVDFSRNASDLRSILTLPSSQWKQLKLLTCKAEHSCFSPSEKTINLAEPSATAPLVEIRRYLPDLQKGNSSVLECDVTQLSSSDILITFQASGVDISDSQLVKIPRAPGLHSISRRFTVPSSHWKNDANFTCDVNQGFTRTLVSESTGKLIGDLNQVSISEIEKVKTAKVFTCQVVDRSLRKNVMKNISICSAPSPTVAVQVQEPPLTELQQKKQVTVTCLLIGSSLNGLSITWKVDGEMKSSGFTKGPLVKHSNGTETLRCFLSISAEDWLAHKQVHCEAKHQCSNQSYDGHVGKSRELSPPTVRIFEPTSSDLSTYDVLTLLCLVSGFFPSNLVLHWEKDGQKLDPIYYATSVPWKSQESSTYSLSSRLNTTKAEDKGSFYSCVVAHKSSENPFKNSFNNVSVTYAEPLATLLEGAGELLCLVSGFSPALINIAWFLDNTTELLDFTTTEPHRGPDGRFIIQSHLHLSRVTWFNGTVTCRVEHFNTTIALNISRRAYFHCFSGIDELSHDDVDPDMDVGSWYMAFTFLLFFLIAIIYSVFATTIKT
ncbi:immunoglobulin mu heavy chain-like [Nelusetta ayraudi]|uniref:immunoglobulin mu heavy chain-like n=1 Tax=Nelusetta ayraudi TaxID=303726 RepID=UPI003F72AFAB